MMIYKRLFFPIAILYVITFFEINAWARSISCNKPSLKSEQCKIVQDTISKISAIYKVYPEKDMSAEKHDAILKVLGPRFDFPKIVKGIIASGWRKLTQDEKDKSVESFRTALKETYIEYADHIGNSKEITVVLAKQDSRFAVVETKVYLEEEIEDGEGGITRTYTVSIDYKFHFVEEEWKIYDVYFEGFSQINYYRARFQRTKKPKPNETFYDKLMERFKVVFK